MNVVFSWEPVQWLKGWGYAWTVAEKPNSRQTVVFQISKCVYIKKGITVILSGYNKGINKSLFRGVGRRWV